MTVTVLAGGRPLTLLPEKAALLEASRTLLVADAHIGKAVSFRALGVPVPRGTTSETVASLSALVERTGARRVVFLGDFLHSVRAHAAATVAAVSAWRERHAALELVLVRGNHDDRAGDPPRHLRIEVVDEPFMDGGFALCHHPRPRAGAYVLAGHLHPCVGIGGRAWDHLRLPCFWLGDAVGVLPAFGAFTGMHPIRAATSDRVFPIADRIGGDDPPRRPTRRLTRRLTRVTQPRIAYIRATTLPPSATAAPISIEQLIARADALLARIEAVVPQALRAPDWSAATAFRYRRRGNAGGIDPVRGASTIRLAALVEVGIQKERLVRNTEQFVAGRPANNVLLTGARGTGKSSLIKACLNEFAGSGLRLIEVDKNDLVDLPDIVDLVAERLERFVVFCDDLSFDAGEPGYKALKSILDGSIAQASDNVLVYATSNRRHLLPETMKENLSYVHTDDGEVHPGEAIEEKISLSERFGLWLSFYPFSQDEYLAIVAAWLSGFGVDAAAIAAARQESLVWALERGSRSGRVAYQFARDYAGRRAP